MAVFLPVGLVFLLAGIAAISKGAKGESHFILELDPPVDEGDQ